MPNLRFACLLLAAIAVAVLPTTGAQGQENAPARTRVILLGTAAGPILRKERAQPANLLVVDRVPYLIDAGEGVVGQLQKAGFAPDQLRGIFITHHHLDHDAGLVSLMAFIWSNRSRPGPGEPRSGPVAIVGPPGTKEMVRAALDYLAVPGRILDSHGARPSAESMFEVREVAADGLVFTDSRLRVTAAENTHFHLAPGSASAIAGDKSFSYRFDAADRSVVFVGDTGPSQSVSRLAQGADVLVSEVNDPDAMTRYLQRTLNLDPDEAKRALFHTLNEHLTSEDVGRLATAAHVGAVVLTHIAPGYDGEADTAHYSAGVKRHYAGPVVVGSDLQEY